MFVDGTTLTNKSINKQTYFMHVILDIFDISDPRISEISHSGILYFVSFANFT